MNWTDVLLAGAIVLGAVYLIYRSLWKKPGYCPGCDSRTCGSRPQRTNKGEKSWCE